MKIMRNGKPVEFLRANEPHDTGDGVWHGDFTVPDLPVPDSTPESYNAPRRLPPSHADLWLGTMIHVEASAVTVPNAKVVAVGNNRIEWEGAAA